jgi:hypothetical protein
MQRLPLLAALVSSSAFIALAACGGGGSTGGSGTNTFPTGTTATGSGGATTTSSGTGGDVIINTGTGNSGGTTSGTVTATGGAAGYLIYASTDTDLYTMNPLDPALTLNHIGTFDCITAGAATHYAMTDIAVDKDEHLWGVTGHDLVSLTVQGSTVHCGPFIPINPAGGLPNPTFYALTVAPVGTISATEEVLVGGNSAGELWRIDVSGNTATTSIIGNFGTVPADDGRGHTYANAGKAWELSGDIVFLYNGGSPIGFATVRDCPTPPSTTGCSFTDTLLEIDMSKLNQATVPPTPPNLTQFVRGQLTDCSNPAKSFGAMYGIAAWADKVYGFAHGGLLVEISNNDGKSCYKGSYSGSKFSGAAVTTLAPVVAPPVIN